MSPSSLECTNCNILANWLEHFCLQSPSSVALSSSPSKMAVQKLLSILPGLNHTFYSAWGSLWVIFEEGSSGNISERISCFWHG